MTPLVEPSPSTTEPPTATPATSSVEAIALEACPMRLRLTLHGCANEKSTFN
jgi:hypothetical protein